MYSISSKKEMEVFRNIRGVSEWVQEQKAEGRSIGFVPTMGALHRAHLELVRRAGAENDAVVCSIFVNPIQFNNPEDLRKYPRTLDADLAKLSGTGCSAVFCPGEKEMYPEKENKHYNFGHLDKVMEGKYRRGHFNGVAIAVDRLFRIVRPHRAYFGEKDYQQLQVIKAMTHMEGHPVEIVPCPTIRENDGLAMSSRNIRLSPRQREEAPRIYNALLDAKKAISEGKATSIDQVRDDAISFINTSPELRVEYFEIVDPESLLPVKNTRDAAGAVGCIAVYAGDVRLIDNLPFN